MPDVMLDNYLGFEILGIQGLDGIVCTFWARAVWDHDTTLYAPDIVTLRKEIWQWWHYPEHPLGAWR